MRKINYLVIHCTSTLQTASLTNIQTYWSDDLFWQNPGLHYIICPDGKVVQMLGIDKVTSGIVEHNKEAVNIGYIGGIDQQSKAIDNRTAAQKVAILKLLRTLKEKFPKAKIQGYRDFIDSKNNKEKLIAWEQIKENPCYNAIPEYSHL
jgi:N-acetylmuramoyl-L-alanine amidase